MFSTFFGVRAELAMRFLLFLSTAAAPTFAQLDPDTVIVTFALR
jgi:hypothetical protein